MQSTLRYFLYQIRINKKNGAGYSQLNYFLKWLKSLNPDSSSVKDEQPWVTYDAIAFLKTNVNNNSKVFEYGGGGSTIFFLKKAKEVITVEHDKEWFQILSKFVKDKKHINWKGAFIGKQQGDFVQTPNKADPEHYASGDEKSKGFHYKQYVSHIDNFSDNYFDFVIVDGRSRASCINHSINKIKSGGFLILDNSDRTYYVELLKEKIENNFRLIIDNVGASPYSETFTKTTIWQKK